MAGHSKWANIKHRKGKSDLAKGKAFSRVTKELITAVKQGGPDPKNNPRLRFVLQKARAVNLPNENIERNIKKASSEDQADFSEVMYELYGYGGVGIIAQILTDNKNRTSSEIRIATNKKGGTVATPGSVAFNFDRKGILEVAKDGRDEEGLFLLSVDAGAEDFSAEEENFLIVTAPDQLFQVKDKLEVAGVACREAELRMVPKLYIECDAEAQKANWELIEYLEELEDVDSVYHNMKWEE